MKMRNVPLLQRHYELNNSVPLYMATGFAAFLLYMKVTRKAGNKYFGEGNAAEYEIKDDAAEYFYSVWNNSNADKVAIEIMANEELWGTDLTQLPGLLQAVQEHLQDMMTNGVLKTVEQLEKRKVTV
jgi:tagaturonate reductase